MRLDPAALADGGSFLDFNERADECLISDPAAIKIYRLNNGNVFAEVNALKAANPKLQIDFLDISGAEVAKASRPAV